MSTATVDHQPPTPPLTHPELDYSLHQLVPHNERQDSLHNLQEKTYSQSVQPISSVELPELAMQDPRVAAHYPQQYYAYSQYPDLHDPSVGLGIQFGEPYGTTGATYYHHDNPMPQSLPYSNSGMQLHDPPTPLSVASDGRRTRSGRSAARTTSPPVRGDRGRSRVSKTSPKPRRSKTAKAEKPKTPELTAPLSELTKDMTIPVRDMDAWVNRPVEVRLQEVNQRKGYVTRPMNSFMLYRSAYTGRAKEWGRQNNHQVVSSISGESWPMEPPEVREKYNDLAKLERINHQKAHPDYKFSPSKAGQSRKRRGTDSDEDEDADMSDFDDGDAAWTPSAHRKTRPRPGGRSTRDLDYSQEMTLSDPYGRSFGPNGTVNKSTWDATNEGRPIPATIGSNDLYGYQYYQTSVHPNVGAPGTEDVRVQKTNTPAMQSQATQPLLGLPGGHHYDLMSSRVGTPMSYEHPVDPQLLGYNMPASIAEQDPTNLAPVGMGSHFDEQYGDLEIFGGEVAPPTNSDWDLDPDMGSLAADTDLEKWGEDFAANH
ncbi:MAG: hypothetical protein M1822_003978 [Bathelium mastoideum]|nr:MAG: hypothetical protein M1822_003978 [Bathelium mastoideum]